MSHYTVAIFTKDFDQDIDAMLAPYDESITEAPYVSQTKDDLIKRERDRMQLSFENRYAEWTKDKAGYEAKCRNPEHIDYLRQLPELMKRSDEELYAEAIKYYDEEDITADGGVLSTYNRNSKWDWYVVGGRWHGMLLLKEGATGDRGEPAFMSEPSDNYDIAAVCDIDFAAMEAEAAKTLIPYEKAIKEGFFKEEYMLQRFPTEEEYIKRGTAFHTYAVVTPDGIWHAPGDMGWWGMHSATADSEREWELNFHDRFIKPAIEKGWILTIVDCHI